MFLLRANLVSMRELQAQIIAATGVKPTIDPQKEAEARVQFLVDYLRATKARGFVLGISGGVDSSCAGRLAQLAVTKVRTEGGDAQFVAMRLPYKLQADEDDAQAALNFICPDELLTFNVAPMVDALVAEYKQMSGAELTDFTKGNAKARARMVAQYAVGGDRGLLVLGTDHAAENVTGFFTKYGDGGADLLPLSGLNKRQVRAVAGVLGAPESVWKKTPTADLLDGKPQRADEDELGIPYDMIDDYLEGRDIPVEIAEKLEAIWLRTEHKRQLPATPSDTWWR